MWSQVLTNSCLLFSCGNPTYLLHKGISTDRSSREYIEKISRVFRSFCFFFFLTTIGLVVLDELVWLILPMLMHIKRSSEDKGTTPANPAHFQTALRTLRALSHLWSFVSLALFCCWFWLKMFCCAQLSNEWCVFPDTLFQIWQVIIVTH